MIGYQLDYPDNESYAFHEQGARKVPSDAESVAPEFGMDRSWVKRCPKCGQLLSKWTQSLSGLVLRRRKYDVSATYDGITVVSRRFKVVYDDNKLMGLSFVELPDDPGWYSIVCKKQVAFDWEKRKSRFGKKCGECGQYNEVIGSDPVYLRESEKIAENGFARTDVEFGSEDEKHPLLLCGSNARAILKGNKLKGLLLVAIE